MSAITLYSIGNALAWSKASAQAPCVRSEVTRFPRLPVVTRKWIVEIDENGRPRLIAHWASPNGAL